MKPPNAVLFVGASLLILGLAKEASALFEQISIADLLNLGTNNQFSRPARSSARQQDEIRCGYESCPATSNEKINVHVIAHSHDDVGWLKTVDQYYYGTKKRYNAVGVRHILNSVVPQLVMDPRKRFIYVEMSFFYKWWEEQEEPMRDIVRRLVNEGRLEFINGGWCMNDEATVNYQSTIEQMTLGLKFLNETFGQCGQPKTGWQIDPFGHTSEQASLFAQFGFDSMFVARISFEDKLARRSNKSMDIVWHADEALDNKAGSIYTNVMWEGYDAPHGFCFDAQCLDDEIVDNKKSYEYNIQRKAFELIDMFHLRAQQKLTNDLLMPFGGDFQFMAAEQNFLNIDKLIKFINEHAPGVNMFYSTPSCYAHAVHQHSARKRVELPEKFDDFMPYDSTPTIWWSGYFTSRPSVKLIERQLADLLQLTRLISFQLLAEQSKRPNFSWSREVRAHEDQCLMPLWEILGDMQHHDAVTGTEKQHVADDYVRRAQAAVDLCSKFVANPRRQQLENKMRPSSAYKKLAAVRNKYSNLEPIFLDRTSLCSGLNISQCEPLESNVDYMGPNSPYKLLRPDDNNNQKLEKPILAAAEHRSAHHDQSVLEQPQLNRTKKEYPAEFETRGVMMHAYNPYSHAIKQHDFRLPCLGMCDLMKLRVIQLANNASLQLVRLPVPSGVTTLPFRDASTLFEVLFYADLPPLGYTSFLIEDLNTDELIDEELDTYDVSSETAIGNAQPIEVRKAPKQTPSTAIRYKRIKRDNVVRRFDYFELGGALALSRQRRGLGLESSESEKIVVKFDLQAGVIVGLKRVSDGSTLNITQKFGYYYPANSPGPYSGAYIFRPNTSEPFLFEKPSFYKMYKRKNGALVEIHQKWNDWIWQTIRVDSKKNYIEFDYVVGPVPVALKDSLNGREVITRYVTDMKTDGIFMTDSNARQLLVRKTKLDPRSIPQDLGKNFYPVVSTMMLKNIQDQEGCTKCKAEAVSVLTDRSQAGASLNDGQLELLVHRRLLKDDNFGVNEALDEPGEDGRGLVARGKHRLFLKFPKNNVVASNTTSASAKPMILPLPEKKPARDNDTDSTPSYIIHDQLLNDLNQEARKYALRPILTFDRLRVTINQFMEMLTAQHTDISTLAEYSLLNNSLPSNIHLLTLQPWSGGAHNQVLIRLENLDNPLVIHSTPNYEAYAAVAQSYYRIGTYKDASAVENNVCNNHLRPRTDIDVEHLLRGVRIVSIEEMNLGANARLRDVKRLNFTNIAFNANPVDCDAGDTQTSISLAPRQIRTLLATFEHL